MSIISDTKEVVGLIREVDNADLYRKIIDLSGEIYELHGEHIESLQRIRELEDQLKIQLAMQFNQDNGFYFVDGDKVPYCPTCWENDGKAIHMTYSTDWGHTCEVCSLKQKTARG